MATEERMLLTPQGKIDLERERLLLKEKKRPQLLERIQELSDDGDVSDNSEFEDVKEELIQLDSRIREIEIFLDEAEVIEHVAADGVVLFGSTVTLIDDEQESETWTIVGPQEANPLQGKISNVSPVGSAVIGKRVGETITVTAPGGKTTFTIQDVH